MASTDPPPPLLDEGLQTANCYSKLLPGELPLLLRHLPHSIAAPSSVRSKSANNFEGCHKRGGERKRNERRTMRRLNQIIIGRVVTKPGPNGRKWVGRTESLADKANCRPEGNLHDLYPHLFVRLTGCGNRTSSHSFCSHASEAHRSESPRWLHQAMNGPP
jgi:hypothetical protein